ncbi:MAG: hypothetical protein V4502_06180 [Pseudomonadota bacterium]
MTPLDWAIGVTVGILALTPLVAGFLHARRQHRANRERERKALQKSAERGEWLR